MRTIKTLGIATAMALALIAFAGAGAASANNFKAAVEPETWSGSLSGKNHVLILGETSFGCEKVSFSGETKTKSLSEVTVAPELNKCAHITGYPESWSMNGCKFRFRPGAGPSLVGTVDIVGCVTPMLYESLGVCRTEIGNQAGLGTVEYQNILVGGIPAIKVIAKLSSITYTRTSAACGEGPVGTFNNGTYQGEWTVKGATTPGGAQAGVEVESTTPPPPPPFTKFVAEEAPVTLAGETVGHTVGAVRAFGFDEGRTAIKCESTTYSGTAASATSTSIVVTPKYHGCSFPSEENLPISIPDENITAGSCSYEFGAKGGFSVVGSTCATKPLSITIPGCTFTVGPQVVSSSGLTYKNEGSGKLRKVSMSQPTELTQGLTYTSVGGGCYKSGTFSTGVFKGTGTFSATNSGGLAQAFLIE